MPGPCKMPPSPIIIRLAYLYAVPSPAVKLPFYLSVCVYLLLLLPNDNHCIIPAAPAASLPKHHFPHRYNIGPQLFLIQTHHSAWSFTLFHTKAINSSPHQTCHLEATKQAPSSSPHLHNKVYPTYLTPHARTYARTHARTQSCLVTSNPSRKNTSNRI